MPRALACLLPTLLIALSGCGTRIDSPASQTVIVPADLHQADDARTIDVSYRFTGDDDGLHDLYRLTFARELEDGGYILDQTPSIDRPDRRTTLQVEFHYDSDGWMMALSVLTLGVVPEMRNLCTTVSIRAVNGQTTRVYEEKLVVSSFRWMPMFGYTQPPPIYPHIADDEHVALGELTRIFVRRLRADRMLASPVQVAAP